MRSKTLNSERLQWARPQIIAASCLPDALGDCVGGSTEITGPQGGCFNGQNTGGSTFGDHYCSTGGSEFLDS